jgi:hypothetical protein
MTYVRAGAEFGARAISSDLLLQAAERNTTIINRHLHKIPMLRIRIRDPVPF